MIIYDFDPRNLPQEYLETIGLVTSCSAQTEACVQAAIAGMMGATDDVGDAMTTHMSAPQKDNTLRALAEIYIVDCNLLDELDVILDGLNASMSKRNLYVHRSWFQNTETREVFTVKVAARGRLEKEQVLMDIKIMKADADAIYRSGMELYGFLARNKFLPAEPFHDPERLSGARSKAARKKRKSI